MQALLLAVALAQAPWPEAVKLRPAASSAARIVGDTAPADALVFGSNRNVRFVVRGPASVEITLYGVMRTPNQQRPEGPGAVQLRVDKTAPKTVKLDAQPVERWSVARRAGWLVTRPHTETLALGAGAHTIAIKCAKDCRLGFGLRVHVTGGPPQLVSAADDEPPLAGLPSTDDPPTEEPALLDAPIPDAEDEVTTEPPLVSNINAVPVTRLEPGFSIAEPLPARVVVRGPGGDEELYAMTVNDGLSLDAIGPAVLLFDFHAHRAAARPETLEPAVIGLLVDDVLVATLSIDQPVDPAYTMPGAEYALSERVLLQLSVPSGQHHIFLSLSDSASLGASIRPRLAATPEVAELQAISQPTPTTAQAPAGDTAPAAETSSPPPRHEPAPPDTTPTPLREDPPRVIAQAPAADIEGSWALTVLAGSWTPLRAPAVGFQALLEVEIGLATISRQLALGLGTGFARAGYDTVIADPRSADGTSQLEVGFDAVPLTADLRWGMMVGPALHATLGVGAGALLGWGETRLGQAARTEQLHTTAVATAHLTLELPLGVGAALLRAQVMPAIAPAAGATQLGGASVALGYSLGKTLY